MARPPVAADEAPTQPLAPAQPSRSLTVRAPEDDQTRQAGARVTVSPGSRTMLIAHVRNESDIVDNYELHRHVPTLRRSRRADEA